METQNVATDGWLIGRIKSPAAWTVVALVIAFLLGRDDEASSLHWLIFVLFGGYLVLGKAARDWGLRDRLRLTGARAVGAFLVAGVVGGVVYEVTLAAGGSGFGGLHEDTMTSFVRLPGYLVPAVLLSLRMVRRYRLNADELFFVAGAMAWYEALTVGGAAMISAPLFALPLVAFYVASYAVYNGAFGLLLIEPDTLWSTGSHTISRPLQIAYAGVSGAVAWVCYIAWVALISAF